jgi:hypothetical protein
VPVKIISARKEKHLFLEDVLPEFSGGFFHDYEVGVKRFHLGEQFGVKLPKVNSARQPGNGQIDTRVFLKVPAAD